MIIATNSIDLKKVAGLSEDYEGLCDYVKSLVPARYAHVDAIYHNTRYYINLEVLKSNDIPIDKKVALSKLLTKSIHVCGCMDIYITCKELESRINMKRVNQFKEAECNG